MSVVAGASATNGVHPLVRQTERRLGRARIGTVDAWTLTDRETGRAAGAVQDSQTGGRDWPPTCHETDPGRMRRRGSRDARRALLLRRKWSTPTEIRVGGRPSGRGAVRG